MDADNDLLRKQIYLTRDLNRRLRESARHSGETESAIIRKALDEYLARQERKRTPKSENPILQMAGMFEGGPDCLKVSEDVDSHLAKGFPGKDR